MFNRWVTIFVAHFLAKRTLEFQSARIFQASPDTFKKPEIKILAVKSEEYLVPSWDKFRSIIRNAFTVKDSDDTVERIIATLETKVIKGVGLSPDAKRSLDVFRKIVEDKLEFYKLRMHCEAVLAALLEARNQAQLKSSSDTETLTKFFKVLQVGLACLDVKCFIHIFSGLAGRYDFSFQIVLPRLLGTLQSS